MTYCTTCGMRLDFCKCEKEVMKCGQSDCDNDATYRYIWPYPGIGESFICGNHMPKLMEAANNLGLELGLTLIRGRLVLGDDVTPINDVTPIDEAATEFFYLQDSRSYLGNDMVWWAEASGYTSDLSKAEVFSKKKAFGHHRSRETDVPWPKDEIDGKTRPTVDVQYLDVALNREKNAELMRSGK